MNFLWILNLQLVRFYFRKSENASNIHKVLSIIFDFSICFFFFEWEITQKQMLNNQAQNNLSFDWTYCNDNRFQIQTQNLILDYCDWRKKKKKQKRFVVGKKHIFQLVQMARFRKFSLFLHFKKFCCSLSFCRSIHILLIATNVCWWS